MVSVQLRGIRKIFSEDSLGIGPIDLDIADGEFVIIVGSSGSGKTTLLRMLAGLENVTEGKISFDGKEITNTSPAERDIAMVFQNYALYPHLSVEENIGFPLKVAKMKKDLRIKKVRAIAEMVELTAYLHRKPAELSGGQRQRVAMARALVREPQLFLLDEPLSNLDAQLRTQTRIEISNIQRQIGVTCVYVTHDHTEAMTLADKIVVMQEGVIQQVGTPLEIYLSPANTFVAKFFGSPSMAIFEGYISNNNVFARQAESQLAKFHHPDAEVLCGVRSEDWIIIHPDSDSANGTSISTPNNAAKNDHSAQRAINGVVQRIDHLGSDYYLYVEVPFINHSGTENRSICVRGSGLAQYGIGDVISIIPKKVHIFDVHTQRRIEPIS